MTEQPRTAQSRVTIDKRNLELAKIAKTITSNGYVLASSTGIREAYSGSDRAAGIGILKDNPKATGHRSSFARLLRGKTRADFIAKLWLENEARRAGGKNWVLEVKGERHLDEMEKFANLLSQGFGVNIRVCVFTEEEKENFYSDYYI